MTAILIAILFIITNTCSIAVGELLGQHRRQ
jgi:hypothetical protein